MSDKRIIISGRCRELAAFMLIVTYLTAPSKVDAQSSNLELGCWSDPDATKPDISGTSQSQKSVSDCTSFCLNYGYPYAGLQFGSKCLCGNSYGTHGASSDCNFTCSSKPCGGYQANSVYYSLDSDLSSQRVINLQTWSQTFDKARATCVINNGDLTPPDGSSSIKAIINLIPPNTTSITSVWIGLWRRVSGQNYEWTNPNSAKAYSSSAFSTFWTPGDSQSSNCVSLNIVTQLLESSDCTKQKPFVCTQLPAEDVGTQTLMTETPSTGLSADSKKLALFIVLPLFLCCYGGSCILYCIHKIIYNCTKARRTKVPSSDEEAKPAQMAIPGSALGARAKLPMMTRPPPTMEGVGGFPLKIRPLSSGKHSARVSPVPPTIPPASFLSTTEPRHPPVQNEIKTKSDDPSDIGMKPLSAKQEQPPPPYDREEARRARLLENAAREARERKQAREGSATSRPSTAATLPPPPQTPPAKPSPPTPEPKDSDTAKLIDKPPAAQSHSPPESGRDSSPSPRSQGSSTPQGLAGMSISDILKMKMAQKADGKRKPRKIIST